MENAPRPLSLPPSFASSPPTFPQVLEAKVSDAAHQFFGRYKVGFSCGEGDLTSHARPQRMTRVHRGGGQRSVLVCATTDNYRKLARSQLRPNDRVLEIGSSYGKATCIIAQVRRGDGGGGEWGGRRKGACSTRRSVDGCGRVRGICDLGFGVCVRDGRGTLYSPGGRGR